MESEQVNGKRSVPNPRETLGDYFFACRDQTAKIFDDANQDGLIEVRASIGRILTTQLMLLAQGAHLLGSRFDALALSKTAVDTLISALHLARQRVNIEVACLLRSALESGCTALHISKDAKAYEAFLTYSYQSTRSITAAKKEIPIVGKLWGALSQAAVHVTRRGYGPKFERDESDGGWVATVDFRFHAKTADPEQDRITLILISLAAEIVARTQELALLDEDPARPGWQKAPGTSAIFCSGTDAKIHRRYKQLLSLTASARSS